MQPCPGPEPRSKACAPQPGPAELAVTWAWGLLCDEPAGDGVVAGGLLTRVPCFPEDSGDLAVTGVAGALGEELLVGKVPAGNTPTRITSTEDFWALAVTGVARAPSGELAVDRVAAGSGLTPVTFTEDCWELAETRLAGVLCGALAEDGGAAGSGLTRFTSTEDCWEGLAALEAGAGDGDLRKLLASHGVKLFPDQLFPELQGSLRRRAGGLTPWPWPGDRTDTISGCSGSFPGGSPLRPAEPLELWDAGTGHLAFRGTTASGRTTTPTAAVFDSGGTPSEWSSVEGCGGDICPSHPPSFQGLLGPEKGGLFGGSGGGCMKVSSVV